MKNAYLTYLELPDDSQKQESYYAECVSLMDFDIREELHTYGLTENDKFLEKYCIHHQLKFNEEFIVN